MTLTAGAILAGGAGRRIGGNKPLRPLRGRPLIEYVIERAEPQVDALWLSAGDTWDQLIPFGLPIVKDDPEDSHSGPLAGIVAALAMTEASGFDQVAVFPCDAPFVPLDMVDRLSQSLDGAEAPGVVVETSRGLQPTFGLWTLKAFLPARAALKAGRLRLSSLCGELGVAVVDCRNWAFGEDSFFNVNTAKDLDWAEELRSADWGSPNDATFGRERDGR